MAVRMMDWLWLAGIAGGAGWLGYLWAAPKAAAPKAAAPLLSFEPEGDDVDEFGLPISLDEPQAANGWVGGPSYGSGAAGPRPDFAMGQQLWQTGGTIAPIGGGSIGY